MSEAIVGDCVAMMNKPMALGPEGTNPWRISRDLHPNSLGHRIAAEEIYRTILAKAGTPADTKPGCDTER